MVRIKSPHHNNPTQTLRQRQLEVGASIDQLQRVPNRLRLRIARYCGSTTRMKSANGKNQSVEPYKRKNVPFERRVDLNMRLLKVHHLGRFAAAVIILLLPIFIFISYIDFNKSPLKTVNIEHALPVTPRYLINTTACKIPDLNPLNEEVLPFVGREEYQACSDKPLLTYVDKSEGVKLKINQSVIALYSSFSVQCCYSYILRNGGDDNVTHSPCKEFYNEVTISYPYFKVVCRNILGVVYQNVHATIIPNDFASSPSPDRGVPQWKIFMLGIDSVSKLNLQRTMPKVYSYLEEHMISLQGYNKIEDNTFPNLMAMLSGRSMDTLQPNCLRNETFDDCDIIWKSFRESGFVTVYGEDEPFLNTFNYYKKGFVQSPTSVYLRPYFLSAYLLPMVYRHAMGVCTGPENTAERMFNAAKDFLTAFRDQPSFAFYWLNSFSHDNVNFATTMEDKLLGFLKDPVISDAINQSVFVIFSDHGFRFGDIRFTYSGWLEERLPFIYFRFPKSFERAHRRLVKNFEFNARNRLITPYDFHMTLQDLLKLSNDEYKIKPSLACPKCQSLFEIVDQDRTCADAAIPQHWCTCEGYERISATSSEVIRVGEYVVEQVNQLIKGFLEEGNKCAGYTLSSVDTVGKSDTANTYLILIKTYPYAMFEATVKTKGSGFELLGQISRLNRYSAYSDCIHNDVLKKYCFCDSWITKAFSYVCYMFKCPVY